MKLCPYPIPYAKINTKWTKDLSIRAKTMKLLEKYTEINFGDLGLGNEFLDMTPKAQMQKKKYIIGLHKN